MNCGPRRPGKGNDMLEIKVNGSTVEGFFDGDFNTTLKDTQKVLASMYKSIKERAVPEKAKEAVSIWKGCVIATVVDIENNTEIVPVYESTEKSPENSIKEIFSGLLKDLQ